MVFFLFSFKRLFVMGLVNGVVNRSRDSRAAEVHANRLFILFVLIGGVLCVRERLM